MEISLSTDTIKEIMELILLDIDDIEIYFLFIIFQGRLMMCTWHYYLRNSLGSSNVP